MLPPPGLIQIFTRENEIYLKLEMPTEDDIPEFANYIGVDSRNLKTI